jgi:hypothetical protein
MVSFGTLMAGIVFGSFGMGYFVYGKKQKKIVPLLAGILLCVFPYFVSNILMAVLIGGMLMALPFLIKV